MVAAAADRVEETAHGLFSMLTRLSLSVPRLRRRSADLKEIEFLTLAVLHDRGTMIVGDIQRLLGVLPAQMSRVIRALEARPAPLVSCHINPRDKRKVNVSLTTAGAKSLKDYRTACTGRLVELLRVLPDEDQEDLGRLLGKLHGLMATR